MSAVACPHGDIARASAAEAAGNFLCWHKESHQRKCLLDKAALLASHGPMKIFQRDIPVPMKNARRPAARPPGPATSSRLRRNFHALVGWVLTHHRVRNVATAMGSSAEHLCRFEKLSCATPGKLWTGRRLCERGAMQTTLDRARHSSTHLVARRDVAGEPRDRASRSTVSRSGITGASELPSAGAGASAFVCRGRDMSLRSHPLPNPSPVKGEGLSHRAWQ